MSTSSVPQTALEAVTGRDLAGTVFLGTDACFGLGAAATRALLASEAKVIVTGRHGASLQEFESELATKDVGFGAPAPASVVDASVLVDLGSRAPRRKVFDEITASTTPATVVTAHCTGAGGKTTWP